MSGQPEGNADIQRKPHAVDQSHPSYQGEKGHEGNQSTPMRTKTLSDYPL